MLIYSKNIKRFSIINIDKNLLVEIIQSSNIANLTYKYKFDIYNHNYNRTRY